MHKGIILLFKLEEGEDRSDVSYKVKSFLEPYGNGNVWDWYVIGGRWTGTLDNYDPTKDPKNIEECWVCNGTGKRNDKLGKEARAKDPSYTCNGCDGKGKSVKFTFEEHEGDIIPLSQCVDVVKEWVQDPEEEAQKMEAQYKERYPKDDDLGMKGYYMTIQGNLLSENFCFDTNVFNVAEWDYSIPEDLKDWYAVMIDIHN